MSNLLDGVLLCKREPLHISTDLPMFASSDSSSSSSSSSNRDVTPRTTPSTDISQSFFHVLCMHDFESSDPVHLPFRKDEVLTVIKQEHSGWWAAMQPRGDRVGWIPSTFVLPLHRSKAADFPDETLWPFENLNDPPLSAVHDPWVPASEDCAAVSFRLVTPTDLVLYKGFFDDRMRNHNCEPLISLQNDEQSSYVQDVPPTPESLSPHWVKRSHNSSPLLSEPVVPQLTQPPSPPPLDATLHRHPRPSRIDDQPSHLCLTTSIKPDERVPEFISSSDIEDSLAVLKLVAFSQEGTHSRNFASGQSRRLGLLTDYCPVNPDRDVPDIELLDLTAWGPGPLAEQFCVLTHSLYATIRQQDCLDWMAGRKSTDVTGLRYFFDVHDDIASWVRRSILAHHDITRQTEMLDFWIRVAEKCNTLRNFDSLCAIILALSGSFLASLASASARCTHKLTIATLRNMLDVTKESYCLMDVMNAAIGPSVPFVRGYLEHIRGPLVTPSDKSPHPELRHATDPGSSAALCKMQLAAVSALLRHRSSPYDFRITEPIRSFINNELQTVRLTNHSLARSQDIQYRGR